MNEKLTCKICNREFKNYISIVSHLKTHKMRSKEYYDNFLKKENEEICNHPDCNNTVNFMSINKGYLECCSSKCSNNLPYRLEEQRIRTKNMWKNKEYIHKMSGLMKLRWEREDFREMMTTSGLQFRKEQAKKLSNKYNDIEYIEMMSNITKQLWKKSEYKEKISEKIKEAHKNDPTIIERISKNIKKFYIDHPEEKIKAGKRSKQRWKDPKLREQMIDSLKKTTQTQKYREFQRQNMLEISKDLEWRKKVSEGTKKALDNKPEMKEKRRQYMLNGGASYAGSFVTNPSKPQVELYNIIKEIYPEAILNYPILNFNVDIVIPSLQLAIEYDGSYWHQDEDYDKQRQNKIEQKGWKFLRYVDVVPQKEILKEDINKYKR